MNDDDDLRDAALEFLFNNLPQLLEDDHSVEAFCYYTQQLWIGFKEDAAVACAAVLEEQREVWFDRLKPSLN